MFPGPLRILSAVLCLACVSHVAASAQVLDPSPQPPPPASSSQEDSPRTPPTGSYRIAGRAVDSVDGRPLRHASINLYAIGPDTRNETAETETDNAGAFSLDHLPAGKYRLQGTTRGYIAAAYDEHEPYSTAIVTGAGVDTEVLVLRLVPAAAVNGRVTDEVGDPVRNANIALFRENTQTGVRRITQFRSARTDDLGAYEITRLPPGTYYLSVRASPWYATYPPPDGSPTNAFGVAPYVDPALSVVYPLLFYPEATDSGSAVPLALKAGDRYHADFHLTPQPAMTLTVHSADAAASAAPGTDGALARSGFAGGRSFPQLQQKVFDTYEPVQPARVQTAGANTVIQGLAPGVYTLRQMIPTNNGLASTGAVRSVDLMGGSVAIDTAAEPALGALSITLGHSAAALPKTLQLSLRKLDPNEPNLTARVQDGHAEFAAVAPGDYRLSPNLNRLHVDSISENGKTTSGALLHVTGAGQNVTVTIGEGSVDISGFVRAAGQSSLSTPKSRDVAQSPSAAKAASPGAPAPGAMVVLVPAGGDNSPALYRRDQSDLDGSFVFANVIPGNYLLVAILDGWSLEWGKPEVLAPYLVKAIPVTVPPNPHGSLSLDEPVMVQPR